MKWRHRKKSGFFLLSQLSYFTELINQLFILVIQFLRTPVLKLPKWCLGLLKKWVWAYFHFIRVNKVIILSTCDCEVEADFLLPAFRLFVLILKKLTYFFSTFHYSYSLRRSLRSCPDILNFNVMMIIKNYQFYQETN